MREKFQRFMSGRYGVDEFSRFLLYVLLALCLLSLFARSAAFNFLITIGLFWIYFRVFSRNHQKRYLENQWYLTRREKILRFFRREKNLAAQRKFFRIYTCPTCKQKIRIPKGHGKIQVTCPKCRTEFIKRS